MRRHQHHRMMVHPVIIRPRPINVWAYRETLPRLQVTALPEKDESGESKGSGERGRQWIAWAILLRRVFEVEVLVCPRCEGSSRIIAAVDGGCQASVVQAMLRATGESRGPPEVVC